MLQPQNGQRTLSNETITEIIDFWLGSSRESPETAFERRDWWYAGGSVVDDEIRARFGGFITQARQRALMDWQATPNGALALVVLLDQFTRNIYRSTPEAYCGDPIAFGIMEHAIENGLDKKLHPVARIWLYHPLHHAEDLSQQDRGLALLNDILRGAPGSWHPYIQRSVTGWTRHRNIVARFDRFPHRNQVLGRETTDAEQTFLSADGESFGQSAPPQRHA